MSWAWPGFSNTTMNEVLQLIKFSLELADLKSCYGVTPEDMVFRDKMYQVPIRFQKYIWLLYMINILPFTKIDTCTIMPEVFINMFMLLFFIYKSCNLLNHAWDSHTIGQFWNLTQNVKKKKFE